MPPMSPSVLPPGGGLLGTLGPLGLPPPPPPEPPGLLGPPGPLGGAGGGSTPGPGVNRPPGDEPLMEAAGAS